MLDLDYSRSSLLVVDVQRGFTELCPDELPVPGGLEIVPAVNQLLALPFSRIDATQDWHPADHCSFMGQSKSLYPPHCVMGTPGADFLPGMQTDRFSAIWRKGYQRDFEAYSVTAQHQHFGNFLKLSNTDTVVICGIAINICCFFAARDLRQQGFRIIMVENASAGIDVPAAGLFQEQAKREGSESGIEYYEMTLS